MCDCNKDDKEPTGRCKSICASALGVAPYPTAKTWIVEKMSMPGAHHSQSESGVIDAIENQMSMPGAHDSPSEFVSNLLKYLIEGLAVAIVAYALPAKMLKVKEVAMIAITGAATFAMLDMYAPGASGGARMGAGFGVGSNLVGFA